MESTLLVWGALGLLELGTWLPGVWRARHVIVWPLILTAVGVSIVVFMAQPCLWSVVFVLLGLYRSLNLYRIHKARMHERYLYRVTWRTAVWLLLEQSGLLLLWLLTNHGLPGIARWQVLAALQLVMATILLVSLLRHLRSTREPLLSHYYADRDLPTLSVAIPARNETEDLQTCLQSLLSNDYPKLEVLVLDDCSQNARTPEIIRSFAHDGVRFVAGSEPSDTWLAKNLAYERLLEAANGELLLFCGVDTRFTPNALRRIVATLLEEDKTMLSVMPVNTNFSFRTALIQPVRYAWELALPRMLFQRPPVLSTCWIIKRAALETSGGFKAVSRSIVPESYFARTTAHNNSYGFIRSGGVTSQKSFSEQKATAIRTRYPQLHRRPEQVSLVTAGIVFGLIGPFPLLGFSIVHHSWLLAGVSALNCVMLMAVYGTIVGLAYRKVIIYAPLLVVVAALYDVGLVNYSMLKYELSEVVWKGRNVCIPVMHVVSSLPKVV